MTGAFSPEALLGLPLERALALLAAAGLPAPQIAETAAPPAPRQSGTLRVVAASPDAGRLTVARFEDAMPGTIQARA